MRARLAIVIALLACDPLASGTWPGEELLRLEGTIRFADADDDDLQGGDLRLELFWSTAGIDEAVDNPVSSSGAQAVTTAQLPARFTLSLHEPPAKSLLRDGTTGRYAIGLLAAYVDVEADGEWSAGDTLAGGVRGHAVVYSPTGASSDEIGAVGAGYHVMRVVKSGLGCDDVHLVKEADPALELEINMGAPKSTWEELQCLTGIVDDIDEIVARACKPVAGIDPCDHNSACCGAPDDEDGGDDGDGTDTGVPDIPEIPFP